MYVETENNSLAARDYKKRLKSVLFELLLLLSSSVLFSLSFPNPLSPWGMAPLGFIALVPVFWVIHRGRWKVMALYGAVYGYLTYALFNYWLSTFNPLAGLQWGIFRGRRSVG